MIRLLSVLMAALLVGCATAPPLIPPQAGQTDSAHDWWLSGRLALSREREGGSGRLEWVQRGHSAELRFHAALGQGSWSLSVAPQRAILRTGDGQVFVAGNVNQLLVQSVAWDIPVDALRYWVRGSVAPIPAGLVQRDQDGRLAHLEQAGWQVVFGSYFPQSNLPRKLSASRGTDKLRLVVKKWGN